MKVSVNWIKQFTKVELPIDDLVATIGAQLGAVEEVVDLGAKYQGVLVAKVVSCEKHPNADKLSLCWIDDGGAAQNVDRNKSGHVQVVCGAPNVKAGLTVAWLPPGATVPSTYDNDPFVLEARELRGVVSNGMLASSKELAISDYHEGIVELDIEAVPGTNFAELYELNDYIIDIENKMFTHRPDCFGILGVAREIAGITGQKFESPDWYKTPLDRIKPGKNQLKLEVKNDITDLVPRFMAVAMTDVGHGNSPLIIQTYLSRVGIRPINNVVDVTNYLMILTGQPTHAYDYDKLNDGKLETRLSRKGDRLDLLNGKSITFEDNSTILITSNDMPIGIGGVMGGAETEVNAATKNIVIECANFDMYSIRRASMRHGLFTDAVTRFNKGQSLLQNEIVLEEAVATMQYVAGAHVASELIDIKSQKPRPHSHVDVSAESVNLRLGTELPVEDMAGLLENVEFKVRIEHETLHVAPPYWRTDIEISEDIVEEIGRLYGFDRLNISLPKRSIKPAHKNSMLELKKSASQVLAKAGANEVVTYSFVHGKLLKAAGQDIEKAFKLSNALSPDLQYYRLSLTPSLLDKVHQNIKSGFEEFALYELGKVHIKGLMDANESGVPAEKERLSFVFAADNKIASKKYEGAAYYQAGKFLNSLMSELRVEYSIEAHDPEVDCGESETELIKTFDQQRSGHIKINGQWIGVIAEPKPSVKKALKLPDFTAIFELDMAALSQFCSINSSYQPLSRYPKVQQDISLRVDASQNYQEVYALLDSSLGENTSYEERYTLTPIDIYQKDDFKHITFRLEIVNYVKTMKSEEVNRLLDTAAEVLNHRIGAKRI